MKRSIALILLFAMLASLACACGGEASSNETSHIEEGADSTLLSDDTQSAAEKQKNTEDSLPDDLDFGGAEVKILTRSASPFDYEMGVESQNADVVNDAIYQRNRTVEERLNVTISIDASIEGNAQSQEAIRSAVYSGDDVYSLCVGSSFHTPCLALEGCFINLNEVKYLDFDQPWWVQNLREEMTLYGQLYFMAGDITLSLLQYESAFFANQKILSDYQIDEDLYTLVTDGKWTLDKLSELSHMVSDDLNGDTKITEDDRFGLGLTDSTRIMALGYGAGMVITQKNSDGVPELAMNRQKTYDIYEKVYSLMMDTSTFNRLNGTYTGSGDEVACIELLQKMFMADQVLFYTGNVMDTEVFRDMNSDYSILPFPKYDEEQENYISYSRDSFSLVVIPATCQNTDLAGAVCEAMAAESYRTVTPAYFDVALKGKYTRDTQSAEMIDLVHSSITFNWGLVNSYSMSYVSHLFQNAINDDGGFASYYAKNEAAVKAGYTNLISYFEKNQ